MHKLTTIVDLYPGGELQLILGNRALCVYRLQTRGEKYACYTADAEETRPPVSPSTTQSRP